MTQNYYTFYSKHIAIGVSTYPLLFTIDDRQSSVLAQAYLRLGNEFVDICPRVGITGPDDGSELRLFTVFR